MKKLGLRVWLGFNFAGKAAVYYNCTAVNAPLHDSPIYSKKVIGWDRNAR